MSPLADISVHQPQISLCSGSGFWCTLNIDTVISTVVAMAITLVVGFVVAARLRSGRPGKLQMLFEGILAFASSMTHETVDEEAGFVVPLAVTLAFFILIANWVDFLPLQHPLVPANSDFNLTLAMGLVVIITVQAYSLRVLGVGGYLRRFTKPFELPLPVRIVFIPLNVIEEVIKPVTLSLRLFGNILAGVIMVELLAALPIFISPLALGVWKFFDVFFIGSIQAFIFMLLTIIYFGMAREGLEEEGHGAPGAAHH